MGEINPYQSPEARLETKAEAKDLSGIKIGAIARLKVACFASLTFLGVIFGFSCSGFSCSGLSMVALPDPVGPILFFVLFLSGLIFALFVAWLVGRDIHRAEARKLAVHDDKSAPSSGNGLRATNRSIAG